MFRIFIELFVVSFDIYGFVFFLLLLILRDSQLISFNFNRLFGHFLLQYFGHYRIVE